MFTRLSTQNVIAQPCEIISVLHLFIVNLKMEVHSADPSKFFPSDVDLAEKNLIV